MVRFAHTADWQLGMTRHFLSPGAQGRYDQARLEVIGRIGRIAASEGCEFIVVCGDVFEHVQVARKTALPALRALGALPVPVYLLPGNHDHLSSAGIFASHWFGPQRPANVHVLDTSGVVEVRPGVELLAAPWDGKQPPADQIDRLSTRAQPLGSGAVRIAVGHGGVDTEASKMTEDPIGVAVLETALAERRIDFVALGDRHSRTQAGTTRRIWYSGSPEPTATREIDPGQLLVVDLEPGGAVEVTAHQVATWVFAERQFALRGADSVDEVIGWLDGFDEPARTVAKPILRGELTLAEHARLTDAMELRRDLFAAIPSSGRSDLRTRSDDGDFADLELTGFAAEALDELRGLDSGEARDALGLLLRLADADERDGSGVATR
ncbi:MAG: metallophosphoesterase family protein [Actinocrinis sp.]